MTETDLSHSTDDGQETETETDADTDLVLPVRSVDHDEQLSDRLTDNVLEDIGPARYFAKDSAGEPVEDWDDVFERVAQNVALAEAVFHDLPLSVGENELADWVSEDDLADANLSMDDLPRDLDEALAPYCDYSAVHDRAPDAIAEDLAHWATEFEQAMRELRWLPNSPTLMNAGTELQMLSACFVVIPGDAMTGTAPDGRSSIMQAAEDAADIFRGGGGVGYPFHLLRPKGARISSTNGISSGPVSFMEIYDTVCGTLKQGGRRRGAQMAIMHCEHPDIGRFCVAKRGEERFTNFNISVGLTDDFLDAVENDESYTLIDPTDGWPDPEAFETVAETAHFYDPAFEDAWDDQFDKPAEGYDGTVVDENFWRDYLDTMQDPDAFEEYRDRIAIEPGEPLELPAGFIWQLLVDGAHNKGEPGFVYLDEANREHSFDVEEHPQHYLHSSNPCVTGDTRIPTADGTYTAAELARATADNESLDVVVDSRLSTDRTQTATPVYITGVKDVYTLETRAGFELRLTADHRVKTPDGWVEAQNLSSGDEIHIRDQPGGFGDTDDGTAAVGRVLGWLVGDGHLKHGSETAVLNFYDDKAALSDSFATDVNDVIRDAIPDRTYDVGVNTIDRADNYRGPDAIEQRISSARLYELADEFGLTDTKTQVPDELFHGSREQARGFLRALFSADGSVQGQGTLETGYSVRLSTADKRLATDVQELLLNFGIYSTVYENRRDGGTRLLPDGSGGMSEYETQALHEVSISAADLVTFNEEIGFLDETKQDRLEAVLDDYDRGPYNKPHTATVSDITPDGTEPVYDLTEPETNSFIANGIVVHNCAEQILSNYEPCNLGHVNLALMVDEDATPYDQWLTENLDDFEVYSTDRQVTEYLEHALDAEQLIDTVRTGTRFLDNVVTMSKFPLDDIEAMAHGQRKIGLGVMGFHELLLQLGIEYGSKASIEVAREVMELIDTGATMASYRLAHEAGDNRGVFPRWSDSKWAQPEAYPDWFERHAHHDPDDWADDGFPMRNHNISTVAPTGTTSMIGNTTGGIEPLYNVAYYKNVGDDVQGDSMLVEVDDYFQRVLEENNVDVDAVLEELEELMFANEFDSVRDLETVPDEIAALFVTTEDLTVEDHIEIQAAFQEHVDSSISKTCNLSNDATLEETSEAIRHALDLGIKGGTVYRIGSRQEEVKTTNTTGGGVPLSEADQTDLVEELLDRLDDQNDLSNDIMGALDIDARAELMDALNVVETTVSVSSDASDVADMELETDGGQHSSPAADASPNAENGGDD